MILEENNFEAGTLVGTIVYFLFKDEMKLYLWNSGDISFGVPNLHQKRASHLLTSRNKFNCYPFKEPLQSLCFFEHDDGTPYLLIAT